MDNSINRSELRRIIRKRKKSFLLVFLCLLFLGFATAIVLPPIYRSEALIRVDEQEIPETYVRSSITDFIDQRIERLRQEILSGDNLLGIINKFGLYADMKATKNPLEIVDLMRKNIKVENVVTELKSKEIGRSFFVTAALNLSYEGKNPETVQKVADTLAKLFLAEDQKRTERSVSATSEFLNSELEHLKGEIDLRERKISEYKQKHLRELPTEQSYNFQAVLRLERELDQADNRVRFLQEKKLLLETQLKNVDPLAPILVEGKDIATNPNQRLKELYLELIRLKSVYSEKHPDIIKVKNEIKELEVQVKDSDVTVEKIKRLQQLEEKLTELSSKYGMDHPDVKAIKNEIALLEKEVSNSATETAKLRISEEKPDNPAYISLMTELNSIKMEIDAIRDDRKKVLEEIDKFQHRIETAPQVERTLSQLTRDLESARNNYQELYNKTLEARASQELEANKQGQRFSIARNANLPIKPYKPNRLLIMVLGVVVAIGAGIFIVALQQGMDNTIKSSDQIKALTGAPPLTSISFIITAEEKRAKKLKRLFWSFITVLLIGVALLVIDRFVIELDQVVSRLEPVWTIIVERVKMMA